MNYGRMKSTADNLLYKNGMPVVLQRYESITGWVKSYDFVEKRNKWTSSTGEVSYIAPANTPTEYEGYGIRTFYKAYEIDGTNIQRGDVRLVLSTVFPEPAEGDKFVMDGETFNYVNHEVKAPGTTELVYIVQVRR